MLTAAFMILVMLLIAGLAYARTIDCNGGDCEGTNNADTMKGSPEDDRMIAREGADTLYGEGNDHARNILICGPGRDRVFFVRGQDVLKGCEIKRPSI